jgi:hypothetical protein
MKIAIVHVSLIMFCVVFWGLICYAVFSLILD